MTDPVFIERDGHRTWLKWHRAKRKISDPVFTGARILEGMRLGASVEVDLVIHADRGYAVLHDLSVERETNGRGKVAELGADALRALRLRNEDGTILPDFVMLLEDLTELLLKGELHPDALLQLDYKEDWKVLDERAIASFKRSVAPVARHMILSSGDAEAVRLLTEGVEGLRIGYDPCHDGALERLQVSRDFTGFVREAVAASPNAEMIYLYYGLVLEADRLGFDVVGAFHAEGRRIDAYTINQVDEDNRAKVARLLELKVDQITTDDPEGLIALVG
ncbi:glycerophosphodiester phosphodiesterase [Devosia psychrophila]|jgi:glycerophosphoryl diester phosphodiesterase|uniref:Glycerophosphodiester phosphodiesterase n=1 Tax=Devosia psychrophila TaxID=728005 RepID=A0A0F5PTR5_9HYPH|nr:glycerophosphodiester phosphodiesterase family protein [Devosia psychrophila]KKC32015.1 glycerophosphodiester phosphodiesterase [Devosia psychrophila]SFC75851.1 Glycerophosphoryl diester phosphodiesterase [Devosia psychrophila]